MPIILAYFVELAVCGCALWALFVLSAFLHEAGHALGYRIATGDRHWHIRVGWGRRLLNTKRLTVSLIPFDGCFTPLEKSKVDTTAKLIAVLSGGPAVSLLLVVGLALLKFGGCSFRSEILAPGAAAFFVNCALSVNSAILLLSLLPIHYFCGKIKGMETDGLQILHAVKRRGGKP